MDQQVFNVVKPKLQEIKIKYVWFHNPRSLMLFTFDVLVTLIWQTTKAWLLCLQAMLMRAASTPYSAASSLECNCRRNELLN